MEIFLVRHLEIPSYNQGLCVGQTNVPLTPKAKEQLDPFAEELQKLKPDVILSSDLDRCMQLAEKLSQKIQLPIEVSPAWREVNFGLWENRSWDELQKNDPVRVQKWFEDYINEAPPEGESFTMFYKRICRALTSLPKCKENRTMVFTHSGAIRASICFALGMKLEDAFSLEIGYGCIVGLRYINKKWLLFQLRNTYEG